MKSPFVLEHLIEIKIMPKIIPKFEIVTAKDGKSTTFNPGKECNATVAQLEGLVKDVHYTEVAESKEAATTGKGGKGSEGGSDEV